MERSIHLNAATAAHYQFALELYLSTMRPYTQELMVWDEAKQRASFAALWKLPEVVVVLISGKKHHDLARPPRRHRRANVACGY